MRWLLVFLVACSDSVAADPPVYPETGLRYPDVPPVPALPEWPDNPVTPEKQELGRALFWDMRLSGSGTAICANCHLASTSFQSATPLDAPDRSYPDLSPTLHRHTPSLLNIVYAPMLRWDGSHFTDLADAMVLPFAEPNLNLSGLDVSAGEVIDLPGAQTALKEKLTVEAPGYVEAFQRAFGEDIRALEPTQVWRLAGLALAVYIRVAVDRDSAFDRWNAGDDQAIPPAAKRGAALFLGRAGCGQCHWGAFLSDFDFHNVSTAPPDRDGIRADDGRYLVTGVDGDRGKFLTPMLRGAARTSPYFHDGSKVSIRDVIRHKLAAPTDPLADPALANLPDLTEDEIDDLVQFLKSMDGKPLDPRTIAPPDSFP
jgi:cytochrome c peroxidase